MKSEQRALDHGEYKLCVGNNVIYEAVAEIQITKVKNDTKK